MSLLPPRNAVPLHGGATRLGQDPFGVCNSAKWYSVCTTKCMGKTQRKVLCMTTICSQAPRERRKRAAEGRQGNAGR